MDSELRTATNNSTWPYSIKSFARGLEETSKIQVSIAINKLHDTQGRREEDITAIGSFHNEDGRQIAESNLTAKALKESTQHPVDNARFRIYFVASHSTQTICSEPFLNLLSYLNTPTHMVSSWIQYEVGGFGFYIDRTPSGEIESIHLWLKYKFPYKPGDQNLAMFHGVRLSDQKQSASESTTLVLLGPTSMYKQVIEAITCHGRQISKNPASLSVILTAHATTLLEQYTNTELQHAWGQIGEVLCARSTETFIIRQQMFDLFNIDNRQTVVSLMREIGKMKRLDHNLRTELNLGDATDDQIWRLLCNVEERVWNVVHQCQSLLEADSRRMSVFLATTSLRSINEMRIISNDTLKQTSQMQELYKAALKNSEEMRVMSEASLKNATQMRLITQATQEFTEEARRDTAVMRTIAVVTMIFLPPTALATVLGLGWFQSSSNGKWTDIKAFYTLAIPITVLTLGLSYAWLVFSDRKEKKNQRRRNEDILEMAV